MAYHATLNFEGNEFDVIRFNCSIERSTDSKGRPSSDLFGGKLLVQIESTDDNKIFESMVSQSKPCSGTITVTKDEEDMMNEIKWQNGFIVNLEERMRNTDGMPMTQTFTVSAQTLIDGGATLEQNWPEVS